MYIISVDGRTTDNSIQAADFSSQIHISLFCNTYRTMPPTSIAVDFMYEFSIAQRNMENFDPDRHNLPYLRLKCCAVACARVCVCANDDVAAADMDNQKKLDNSHANAGPRAADI